MLLEERPELAAVAEPDLAVVVPELAAAAGRAPASTDEEAGRLRVFDAVSRLLGRATAGGPVTVIIDDLQWSDPSTLDLLRFLTGQTYRGSLLLVGAYRPAELPAGTAGRLAALASAGEPLALAGLNPDEVGELVAAVAGAPAVRWAGLVHSRTGGHPFFARELSQLVVTGADLPEVAGLVEEAVAAGLLATSGEPAGGGSAGGASIRFAHDLYRESIYAAAPPARRLDLHHRVATALVHRHERGAVVFPAELARHFVAAVPVAGAQPALPWALAAAEADRDRFAFAEAASHLSRLRAASGAVDQLPATDLVDVLTVEADLWLRAGDAAQARQLLDAAWSRATATGDPTLIGAVALGLDRIGARFAMPRTDPVAALDRAREALAGTATATEAQVTAALARQLQHSVPKDRPRARPLAEQAVAIARTLDDPATLASCLLAHHDVLWTPGTAAQRVAIAGEIAELADRAGEPERRPVAGRQRAARGRIARLPGHVPRVRTRDAAAAPASPRLSPADPAGGAGAARW